MGQWEGKAKELIRKVFSYVMHNKNFSLSSLSDEDIYKLFRFGYFKLIKEYPLLNFQSFNNYRNIAPMKFPRNGFLLSDIEDIWVYKIYKTNEGFDYDYYGLVVNTQDKKPGYKETITFKNSKVIIEKITENRVNLKINPPDEGIGLRLITTTGAKFLIPKKHFEEMEKEFEEIWKNILPYKGTIKKILIEKDKPFIKELEGIAELMIIRGIPPTYENFLEFLYFGKDNDGNIFINREKLPLKITVEIKKEDIDGDIRLWTGLLNGGGDYVDIYPQRTKFKRIQDVDNGFDLIVRVREVEDKYLITFKIFSFPENLKKLSIYFGRVGEKSKTLTLWNKIVKNPAILEREIGESLGEKPSNLYELFKAIYKLKRDIFDKFEVFFSVPIGRAKVIYDQGKITGYLYTFEGAFIFDNLYNVEKYLERVDKILQIRDISFKDRYADLISSQDGIEVLVQVGDKTEWRRYYSTFEYGLQGSCICSSEYQGCYERYNDWESFNKRLMKLTGKVYRYKVQENAEYSPVRDRKSIRRKR